MLKFGSGGGDVTVIGPLARRTADTTEGFSCQVRDRPTNGADTAGSVRVFVASARDVALEAARLQSVTASLAESLRLPIVLVDWSVFLGPLLGHPSDHTVNQITLQPSDVFVGIVWRAFDRIPGKALGSGTEAAFSMALDAWRVRRQPRVAYYRCMRGPDKLDGFDAEAYKAVESFFRRLDAETAQPAHCQAFYDPDEFTQYALRDLADFLLPFKVADASPPLSGNKVVVGPAQVSPASQVPETTLRSPSLELALKPGETYLLSILSVDLVGHSELVARHQDRRQEVRRLLDNFAELVRDCVARQHGAELMWAVDGGLFVFWGEGRSRGAVIAGLQILQELVVFNLDSSRNPLGGIQVRVAAADGPVDFTLPLNQISSPTINLVSHLEKRATSPGEFCVTESVCRHLDERLARTFTYKGRYQSEAVLAYPKPRDRAKPAPADLAGLLGELRATAAFVLNRLREESDAPLKARDFEALSNAIDAVYSSLERFCEWFHDLDERWSPEYVAKVGHYAEQLTHEEEGLFSVLRQEFIAIERKAGEAWDLAAMLKAAGSRRAPLVALLGEIQTQAGRRGAAPLSQGLASAMPAPRATTGRPPVLTGELQAKIQRLLDADDLEEEAVFAELMHQERVTLAALLAQNIADAEMSRFVERLWLLADLVLLEDSSGSAQDSPGVFEAAARHTTSGGRFRSIRSLLSAEAIPTPEGIAGIFPGSIAGRRDQHATIAWRCLLVAHPQPEVRGFARRILGFDFLWQLVGYSRTPLETVLALARKVAAETEDHQKLFFDCVRSRLVLALDACGHARDLAVSREFILLFFTFDFFVQTNYFDRLDDLLRRFLRKAKEFGAEAKSVLDLMARLDRDRLERGTPAGGPPAGIENLPRGMQRRLAREGIHLDYFARRPDDRIAREVGVFIDKDNVEKFLEYADINAGLFLDLTRREDLFRERPPLLLALRNPKCRNASFVRTGLGKLTRSELVGLLSRKVSLNPTVRLLAETQMRQRH